MTQVRTTFGELHRIRDPITKERLDKVQIEHYVEFYTQPTWRRLIWHAYHWYDMRIFKVPGFKKWEDFSEWWHRRRCNDDCMTGEVWRKGMPEGTTQTETYCANMPLSAKQDCRCYELSVKDRQHLFRLDLTHEQWQAIRQARRGSVASLISETSLETRQAGEPPVPPYEENDT